MDRGERGGKQRDDEQGGEQGGELKFVVLEVGPGPGPLSPSTHAWQRVYEFKAQIEKGRLREERDQDELDRERRAFGKRARGEPDRDDELDHDELDAEGGDLGEAGGQLPQPEHVALEVAGGQLPQPEQAAHGEVEGEEDEWPVEQQLPTKRKQQAAAAEEGEGEEEHAAAGAKHGRVGD